MKTRYNKSRIMSLANHYIKYNEYDRSLALKLAWSEARRNPFYQVIEELKSTGYRSSQNSLANSLTDYYANNVYNGD